MKRNSIQRINEAMMIRKLTSCILVFLMFFCLLSLGANAEEFKDDEYYKFVKEVFIKVDEPTKEHYRKLRDLYAHTSFFDPNFSLSNMRKLMENIKRDIVPKEGHHRYLRKLFREEYITHMGILKHIFFLQGL